ncbi:hypothetical protein [Paraglaciecola hydrolytica]|uniref:Uncharacterized protein n=1 Tax=Paraglaciecola hydrolytica TaxID=1799789 RepID=A0A136A2S3_9ALTE|nr:hypothetical protein [Paraglaciecola hydrolytica]KXI29532.1 hypothetical protein AX660_05595 [Paraglaciecola hydrolytica]
MIKNLILAILIAIVLTVCVGSIATQWLDLRVQIDQQWVEPFMTILLITVVVAILVIVGFAVAVSVFGALLFALCAGLVGLFIAGLSVFWPVLLIAFIIYYLVKDKDDKRRHNTY